MYTEKNLNQMDKTGKVDLPDPAAPRVRNRTEGYVIECDGMNAIISAIMAKDGEYSEDYWSVGMLITVVVDDNTRTVGMLHKVESDEETWNITGENRVKIHIELVGEIKVHEDGTPKFNGGISAYPFLGAIAHRIRHGDLAAVFENRDQSAATIGSLSQNAAVPATIAIDTMISRHFAVVGTTGVGKSSSVTMLLRKVIEQRSDVRILILDPHNEFKSAFPDKAFVIDDRNLELPFWAFKLEEFAEVLFRGRQHIPEEIDLLRDAIPRAKAIFGGQDRTTLRRSSSDQFANNVDTPIPYKISDLLKLLEDQMGRLGTSEQRPHLKSLIARIHAVTNDPNFHFMFAHTTIIDNLSAVLAAIFRVPANGRPITAFQLSGIPSEVVNAVVSVLCRLAFDLAVWSDSKIKTLVVCEEAHRYIPANKDDGFAPTRQAIARIAKEGRKYGVSLGIVTQRPGELDETILSQCNTFVAMRLGNELDQEIMRKAIAGASRSFINFLPSLANREAILFGQAVTTPMRMRFATIPQHQLPANHLIETIGSKDDHADKAVDLNAILRAIRNPVAADENEMPIDQNLPGARVDEQRESIEPKPRSDLFAQTSPLRQAVDEMGQTGIRAGRRNTDPIIPIDRITQPAPTPTTPPASPRSTQSLIDKFRKS